MSDETLDRADAQFVLLFELHQLWKSRHRAVVMQNFTENAGWLQAGEASQVYGCLRVTRATQNAAFLRPQGKDVTRLDEVVRPGAWPRDGADGGGTIVGTDAGRYSFRRVD